jgi:DNA-binding transcriptional MerR regulator
VRRVYPSEDIRRLTEELEKISRDLYLAYQEGRAVLDLVKQQDVTASLPDGLPIPPHLVAAVNEREGVLEAARERLENSLAGAYGLGFDSARLIESEALVGPSLAESLRKIGDDLERRLSPENLDPREVAFAQGVYDGLKERAPEFLRNSPVAEEASQQLDRISATLAQAQQSLPTFEREALTAGIEKAQEGLQLAPGRSQDVEIG